MFAFCGVDMNSTAVASCAFLKAALVYLASLHKNGHLERSQVFSQRSLVTNVLLPATLQT